MPARVGLMVRNSPTQAAVDGCHRWLPSVAAIDGWHRWPASISLPIPPALATKWPAVPALTAAGSAGDAVRRIAPTT